MDDFAGQYLLGLLGSGRFYAGFMFDGLKKSGERWNDVFFFSAQTRVAVAGYSSRLLLPILGAWGTQAGVWCGSPVNPIPKH